MKKKEWKVPIALSGASLQMFIKSQLDDTAVSAKAIKRAIDAGHCQVNGRVERYASFKLGVDDLVLFALPHDVEKKKLLEWENERILFEDDYFLVYNKPAGLNCDANGLEKLARHYCKTAQLVHRLDRGTTGVVIIAKSSECCQRFVELFRKCAVKKRYLALVEGVPLQTKGVVHNYLGAIKKLHGQVVWGVVERADGLEAITKWCVVSADPKAKRSLIECQPITGRTHQIRVHLSSLGHPIVGDYQYGWSSTHFFPKRYYLHALSLKFLHPFTHREFTVKADLPEDMRESL